MVRQTHEKLLEKEDIPRPKRRPSAKDFAPDSFKVKGRKIHLVSFDLLIQDSAREMPPDHRLFIDFRKLEESALHDKHALGLGPSICKRLVEHMGGTVSVASEHGTTFTFSFKTTCIVAEGEDQAELARSLSLHSFPSVSEAISRQLSRFNVEEHDSDGVDAPFNILGQCGDEDIGKPRLLLVMTIERIGPEPASPEAVQVPLQAPVA